MCERAKREMYDCARAGGGDIFRREISCFQAGRNGQLTLETPPPPPPLPQPNGENNLIDNGGRGGTVVIPATVRKLSGANGWSRCEYAGQMDRRFATSPARNWVLERRLCHIALFEIKQHQVRAVLRRNTKHRKNSVIIVRIGTFRLVLCRNRHDWVEAETTRENDRLRHYNRTNWKWKDCTAAEIANADELQSIIILLVRSWYWANTTITPVWCTFSCSRCPKNARYSSAGTVKRKRKINKENVYRPRKTFAKVDFVQPKKKRKIIIIIINWINK